MAMYKNTNITSAMMINPLNEKHLEKVPMIDSGIVMINLEDGIAKEQKPKALQNVCEMLENLQEVKSKIVIRINELENGGIQEIKTLNAYKFDALRVPKIKTKEDVKKILEILSKDKELHLSIETKVALANIKDFKIDDRVTTLYLGILDLLNDLQISHESLKAKNPLIDYILAKFILDSKTYSFFPVGFVFQDYNDTKTFKNWCEYLKNMGYEAIGSIGPKQSEIAKEVFGANSHEIQKARYIVEIFEKMREKSITGFMDERYGFIDEPIYKNALLFIHQIDSTNT